MASQKKSNEIYLSRIYDAPVKMVWDAWTDPEQAAKWWGPRGFTITTKSKDLKVGGQWIYTMHGPDGTDYPNIATYYEVEKYSKLVYDHGASETTPALFKVTVTFEEVKGKTKMEMAMALKTEEDAKQIAKFIRQAGGNATWDRLAEYLSDEAGKDIFVINRSFDAPITSMYKMWSDPKHIAQWLPPTDFTMEYLSCDIKVGGESFYKMSDARSTAMYGKIHYIELSPPNRLVYTQIFCDQNGKVSCHPHAPTWPETMLTTITLTEEGPNQTRVTVNWEVYGTATAEERAMFRSAKTGMTGGWTGSFDKLEAYLEGIK
jgi:uncharacterized protein YndB with AHSA1/START domain